MTKERLIIEPTQAEIDELATKMNQSVINVLALSMEECELSRRQAGELLEVSPSRLRQYEQGKCSPKIDTFCELLARFILYMKLNKKNNKQFTRKILRLLIRLLWD